MQDTQGTVEDELLFNDTYIHADRLTFRSMEPGGKLEATKSNTWNQEEAFQTLPVSLKPL